MIKLCMLSTDSFIECEKPLACPINGCFKIKQKLKFKNKTKMTEECKCDKLDGSVCIRPSECATHGCIKYKEEMDGGHFFGPLGEKCFTCGCTREEYFDNIVPICKGNKMTLSERLKRLEEAKNLLGMDGKIFTLFGHTPEEILIALQEYEERQEQDRSRLLNVLNILNVNPQKFVKDLKQYGFEIKEILSKMDKPVNKDEIFKCCSYEQYGGDNLRIEKWPKGYVLWMNGQIVWKSWIS